MITILFFAQLQEDIGQAKVELELEPLTVTALKNNLQEIYKIDGLKHIMTTINEEFAMDDETVNPGDTVAFIPPISGG